MICPDCGFDIPEGKLYCEKCGKEIQIVPDFEPELENSIRESLSTVADTISPVPPKKVEMPESFMKDDIFHGITSKKRVLITTLSFILMSLIIIVIAVVIYQNYSVNYQLKQAQEFQNKGEYAKAITYYEKAKNLEADEATIILEEADCYYQTGEKQKAADDLLSFVQKKSMDYELKEKFYEKIISIYEEDSRYAEINDFLTQSEDRDIQTKFQHYMAMKPEFSFDSGNYEKVIRLKITANTTGKIYYTVNGTTPTERSLIYTAPILMESGEYQISAVFINDYGIRSDVVNGYYIIDLEVPEKPEILPVSGDYTTPTLITAETQLEESKIYYTKDGTTPTENSTLYQGQVEMPLGRTNFKFVVISKDGVSSEVVSRSYDLELPTQITAPIAIDIIKNALLERKVLTDLQGHSPEIEGKYIYRFDKLVEIPDLGYYYKLDEFIQDNEGKITKTDHLYAVSVYAGEPNRLVYYSDKQMGLIPLY